jgi:large subunit ribosomal protein L10
MVREEKIQQVEKIKELIEKYKVIGIIDVNKLPSKQLQEIRKLMRERAKIVVTTKTVLIRGIESANKTKIVELKKYMPLQPAMVLTDMEPFKFYAMVDKMKSPSFAKEGDVADDDIMISAGPTGLLPGPVISEFAKVKIPAGVEGGKIVIKKDVVVAKRGDRITKELASVLRKLKIAPIKIGLNLIAIYDNGLVYTKDVLNLVIDIPEKLKEAYNKALNLSISICYPTKENIKYLLAKAFNSAKLIESKIGGVN